MSRQGADYCSQDIRSVEHNISAQPETRSTRYINTHSVTPRHSACCGIGLDHAEVTVTKSTASCKTTSKITSLSTSLKERSPHTSEELQNAPLLAKFIGHSETDVLNKTLTEAFGDCELVFPIATHIWRYMRKYHSRELEDIELSCHLDELKKNNERCILRVTANTYDDFTHKFQDIFRPLYEQLTSEICIWHYQDALKEDHKKIIKQVKDHFKCMAYLDRSGLLEVICLKTDKKPIIHFMQHIFDTETKVAVEKSLPSSQFEPSGYFLNGGAVVFIHMNDIISLSVDAITNPSNPHLVASGGLFKVIAAAAGRDLVEDCKRIMKKKGRKLDVGEVVCTRAGSLPASCVLHVTGPVWLKDEAIQTRCFHDLVKVFHNVIRYADEQKLNNIAIPPISSGTHGVPDCVVADAAHEAIRHNKNVKHLREIHFVDNGEGFLVELLYLFETDVKLHEMKRIGSENVQSRIALLLKSSMTSSVVSTEKTRTSELHEPSNKLKLYSSSNLQESSARNSIRNQHEPSMIQQLADVRYPTKYFLVNKSVMVLIEKSYLIEMEVDAIVEYMCEFTGTAFLLLLRKTGQRFIEYCEKLKTRRDFSCVSSAIERYPGYAAYRCKECIVIPQLLKEKERLMQCLAGLQAIFNRMFTVVQQLGIQTVACPFSFGDASGVPVQFAANAMCDTLLNIMHNKSCLKEIHIPDLCDDTLSAIYDVFASKLGTNYLKEMPVDKASSFIEKLRTRSAQQVPTSATLSLSEREGPQMDVNEQNDQTECEHATKHRVNHLHEDEDVTKSSQVTFSTTECDEQKTLKSDVKQSDKLLVEEGKYLYSVEDKHSNKREYNAVKEEARSLKATEQLHEEADDKVPNSEACVICLSKIVNPKTLPCKHTFCKECIDEMFHKYQCKCPFCGIIYGENKGDQPNGDMSVEKVSASLPGYEDYGTIIITYNIPSGIQEANHPNPGQPYCGTQRRAYLPDSPDGQNILDLLKRAFACKLIFTIGHSATRGEDGVVTWNDVHHKTSPYGGPTRYGYPDPTYLSRVRQELADKGIK